MTSTTERPLETGWLPDTPTGDTIQRRFLLHYAEMFVSVAETHGGRVLRRPDVVATDLGRPAALYNSAVLLQPLTVTGAETLGAIEEFFAGGRGEVDLWSAWPTPDLRPRGWGLHGHPPLLVRPQGGRVPPEPEDLEILEARDARTVDDFSRVAVNGYPFKDLQPYRTGVLLDEGILDDSRWRLWVGYDHGRPVAIGALFVEHGLAQLALGVTLPEARGRGYWYGLIRRRLLARPDLMSGAVFSDDSRPGVERLGYLPLFRFTLWYHDRRR